MILILTHSSEQNVLRVIDYLNSVGTSYYRLNVDQLNTECLSLNFSKSTFDLIGCDLSKVTAVWERKSNFYEAPKCIDPNYRKLFISEHRTCVEFLANELKHCYWMNPIQYRNWSHNQLIQLRLARECGLRTPKTLVSNNLTEAIDFVTECSYGAIIKTIGQFDIIKELNQTINTSGVDLKELLSSEGFENCPSLIQEKIEKDLEIRATYVGGKFFVGAMEIINSTIDERMQHESAPWFRYQLPADIEDKLKKLHDRLKLEFGGVDLILDKSGLYHFLETNPSGQYDWVSEKCNLMIHEEIGRVLNEKARQNKN